MCERGVDTVEWPRGTICRGGGVSSGLVCFMSPPLLEHSLGLQVRSRDRSSQVEKKKLRMYSRYDRYAFTTPQQSVRLCLMPSLLSANNVLVDYLGRASHFPRERNMFVYDMFQGLTATTTVPSLWMKGRNPETTSSTVPGTYYWYTFSYR